MTDLALYNDYDNGTYNLFQAIANVRALIQEDATPTTPNGPNSQLYTDTMITQWINEGLRDVSRRAEELITFDTSVQIPAFIPTLISNAVPKYDLPNDIVRIQRVEFVPVLQNNQIYKLEPSTQNSMDQIWGTYQQNPSTYPRWFVTLGYPGGTGRNTFQIQMYPVPSQAGNLNIFYYRLPIPIPDPVSNPSAYTQTLDIIVGWEDMVVNYAVYKAFQRARNPEWQQRKQEYEEQVTQIIDVTRKFHDQQDYISYGTQQLPGWLVGGEAW